MNELTLEKWFPTVVGFTFNENHKIIEQKLVDQCHRIKNTKAPGGSNWISKQTYNTSDGVHELFLDDQFSELNDWVDKQVAEYCKTLRVKGLIVRNSSWFNIYHQNDYQELHTHPGSAISAIYCLSGHEDGAKIFFKSPKQDMFDLKFEEYTNDNHSLVHYKFQPGKLMIFLSDTIHSVEKHLLESERISISYNYRQEKE